MRQPAFWLAVAGVSLITTPLFHLLADSEVGARFQGLRDLDSYLSRRNG
jgi:hypothetical protein